MRARLALALALAAGCSSTASPPRRWSGPPPAAVCDAPALADVSQPTSTVTNCTQAGLQAAATAGGIIVFDCGPADVTITVTSPIVFKKESVLDGRALPGRGAVTLSGGGTSRILLLDSGYDQTGPRLTVQRLTFMDGASKRVSDDTDGGGAAIYRDGGSLTVIDCVFDNNHAPSSGPDLAGGAIYGFGGGETLISGSTFANNSASDGGAVGSLNGDLVLVNSQFTGNAATGTGGNPGNGGCGGAIYMDGADEKTSLCGVTIANNQAGAIGGGFFRVSNYHDGTFAMERTTVDSNQVASGNAGGLYLEGLYLNVTNSTISRNLAGINGGIWISTGDKPPMSGEVVSMTNVTIAGNTTTNTEKGNGGGIWLSYGPTGALVNCTIAGNVSAAESGAIFGEGLTLRNSIVEENSAHWSDACETQHGSGETSLEWPGAHPDGSICTASPLVADPQLGLLGQNGGPTETLLPGPASPARGLGTDCPATDQRGQPRKAQGCTAGAVEIP